MATIEIEAEPTKPVDVKLVGQEYSVTPPKTAILVVIAKSQDKESSGTETVKHLEDIVKIMFRDQSQAIFDRLYDVNDELDYQHVVNLAQKLVEHATGNPTT